MNALADAWEYVQAHEPLVRRFANSRRFRRAGIDADEFAAELRLRLVAARELRDPERLAHQTECALCGRRGCRTWIFVQARYVSGVCFARPAMRYARAIASESALGRDVLDSSACSWEAREDAKRQVHVVLELATDDELAAVRSRIEGWSEDELRARLGIGRAGRNWRIRRLRKRLEEVIDV